jgi:SAM-dependent methyltransferase
LSTVSEHDGASLERYLGSFRWPGRDEENACALVRGGLPLWRQILRRVPNPPRRGRALELGSPPFHISLLLQRFRNYDLTLSGATADGRPELTQELTSDAFGERHRFVCRCFDLERDRFPYPDAHFDLVLWCEVIEHLTENPVQALSEIHRVLAPGGMLVISTPNVARADNVLALLRAENVFDPYHLGAPLRGSRHSREYTADDLRDLVGACGFRVDMLDDVDLLPPRTLASRVMRTATRLLGRARGTRHGAHLFLRATRTATPFRWSFPERLFDGAHLPLHVAARDRRVVMGENDLLHTTFGWTTLERGPDGRSMRRCRLGDVYLVADEVSQVTVTATGGHAEVEIWVDEEGRMLAGQRVSAPAGEWRDATLALPAPLRSGRLHVRIVAPDEIGVHAVTAA